MINSKTIRLILNKTIYIFRIIKYFVIIINALCKCNLEFLFQRYASLRK